MTHRALTLLAVIGVAFAAAGLLFAGAANASGHSATRTITPASVAAGGQVTVTIAFDISGFGSVTETLPEGFTYVSSDPAGLGDADGQDVTFVPFDVPDDTFTYTVTASMVPGDYSFSGTVQDSRKDTRDVGGDTAITVTATEPTPTEEPTAEPTEEPTAEPTEEPTAEPAGPSATRSFPSSTVEAGGMLDVTITAADYGDHRNRHRNTARRLFLRVLHSARPWRRSRRWTNGVLRPAGRTHLRTPSPPPPWQGHILSAEF